MRSLHFTLAACARYSSHVKMVCWIKQWTVLALGLVACNFNFVASTSDDITSLDDLTYDYPDRLLSPLEANDLAELLDGKIRSNSGNAANPVVSLRQLINGLRHTRRDKKNCNIGAGLSGPCNNNDAVAASKSFRFFSGPDSPGRRRRDTTKPSRTT